MAIPFAVAVCVSVVASGQTPPGRRALPANADSQMTVKYLWDTLLAQCGDSWLYGGSEFRLAKDDLLEDLTDSRVRNPPRKVIWEYKGVTFRLEEGKLSQAARLNGIEWGVLHHSLRLCGGSESCRGRCNCGGTTRVSQAIPLWSRGLRAAGTMVGTLTSV